MFLVDYDAQTFTPAPGTSPDAADSNKTPLISIPNHHPLPLPSLQPLSPSPYKQRDAPATASQLLAAPNNDPKPPKNSTATHQIIDSDITTLPQLLATPSNIPPLLLPVPDLQRPMSTAATPTIIIHAQTVVIGGPPSSHIVSTQNAFGDKHSTTSKSNTTYTRNSVDRRQAPDSPFNPYMPPRDLSALWSGSRSRLFYSLQRCSRRCQSMPVRGHNWDTFFHHRDFSRA